MADTTRSRSTLRAERRRSRADRRRRPARARRRRPDAAGADPAPRRRARQDLRPYLAPIETERQVTDWGRSERVEGFFDRTLYDFYYNLWFRCEVEGIEHVPSEGGALLVSNHSGALPPDAPMIAKAIKEEHAHPRPLHLTMEHFFKGYPGLSMLLPKIGGVPAHPANVHRLLADEQQLVLVFPEGRKGSEKLYKERYRLRRFGRGGFVEAAMRARAPIVPIAVVGAEEAMPIFAHVRPLAEAHRADLLPDHAVVPALRPARHRLPAGEVQDPLPAAGADRRPRRRALGGPGAGPDDRPRHPRDDPGRAARHARQAQVGVVRMSASRRILITGLSTYWGGRLAQALERNPEIETVIGIDRTPPKLALERTEFVQVSDAHSLIRRIVDAAEIDTIVDTRLVVDSIVTSRSRAHENNVIGTMNVLAAAGGPSSPVRKLVFKSSARYYGAEQDDPAFFTEDMRRPHPPTHADRARHRRGRGQRPRLRATRTRDTTVTVLRFANALGPDLKTSWQTFLGLPAIPSILGFDPRVQFIHEDDMANCLEHAVKYDLPARSTARPTASWS